jgi:hypothetical protein
VIELSNDLLLVAAVFLLIAVAGTNAMIMFIDKAPQAEVEVVIGQAVNSERLHSGRGSGHTAAVVSDAPPKVEPPKKVHMGWYLVTGFAFLSGVFWVAGFNTLIYQLENPGTTTPTECAEKTADPSATCPPVPLSAPPMHVMLPLYMKLLASCFFTLTPMTALLTNNPTLGGGVPWANWVGIILFHFGNIIGLGMSIADAHAYEDAGRLASSTGKVAFAHFFFCIATTLLLNVHYTVQYKVEIPQMMFAAESIGGALLLLIGCSIIKGW